MILTVVHFTLRLSRIENIIYLKKNKNATARFQITVKALEDGDNNSRNSLFNYDL